MNIKETLAFENNLYNLINTCGLPLDTAFYVLKSVYLDFQKTLYEYSTKEDETTKETQEVYTYNVETKEQENEQSVDTNAS